MHGSRLSIVYKLGLFVIKLSIEETPSPSKKNCVVISLPLLFTHVRKHPFSTKNIFLERLPSANSTVLAGTSNGVKRGLRTLHLSGIGLLCDMTISFLEFKKASIYDING